MLSRFLGPALVTVAAAGALRAQQTVTPQTSAPHAIDPDWTAPQRPFRIYANTYYVGTHGIAAILVTGDSGHVLIDAGLPESAPMIVAHVRELGFRIEDVRVILNSHAHYDHAGGIAALQRASGAVVDASPWSAGVIGRGASTPDDPQYGIAASFPAASRVHVIADGETVRVGALALTAHFTAGHTPGGTTWTWRSCEGGRCVNVVYADSQTPVSADNFFFTRTQTYPTALEDFSNSFTVLESLPCDLLLTPHPGASGFWERVAARDAGKPNALIDGGACKRFAATARKALAARVSKEIGKP